MFGGKKFGLRQARVLAGESEAHLPTVKATLKVLGVKNVVGQEAAQIVAGAEVALKGATDLHLQLRAGDVVDEKGTLALLAKVRADRENRAHTNASAIRGTEHRIAGLQAQIADLRELAKKFA